MATTVLLPGTNGKITVGTWTHTAGAAAETIAVGGIVFGALISSVAASGAYNADLQYSVAVSGNVSTITFYPQNDVTDGRFIVFHSGS